MTLSERVAYLKGLAEGMELGDSKQEKLLKEIIGVLENVASDMLDVEDDIIDIGEQVDEIDEDLAALEDEVYCDEDDDDDLFYEVTCPSCSDTICLDEETLLDGSIDCPNCGERLEFECECSCEDCEGCDEE